MGSTDPQVADYAACYLFVTGPNVCASPPTEAEARTVRDYLHWIVNIEPGGGQLVIGAAGTDGGKLPAAVFNVARPGTELIEY